MPATTRRNGCAGRKCSQHFRSRLKALNRLQRSIVARFNNHLECTGLACRGSNSSTYEIKRTLHPEAAADTAARSTACYNTAPGHQEHAPEPDAFHVKDRPPVQSPHHKPINLSVYGPTYIYSVSGWLALTASTSPVATSWRNNTARLASC